MDENAKIKIKASKLMVQRLQKLFAEMLLSNFKYQNPLGVLQAVVDDDGKQVPAFEQKDIGEFFLNFLDRLQDGLGENKTVIRKLMGEDFVKNCCHAAAVKKGQGVTQEEMRINSIYAKPLLNFDGSPQLKNQKENGDEIDEVSVKENT